MLLRRVIVILALGLSLACGQSTSAPTAPSAVAVTSVAPRNGPPDVATQIRVDGSGFEPGATVTLDGIAAKVGDLTSTSIVATTPIHALGTVDLVVRNPDGTGGTLVAGYTFGLFSVTPSITRVGPGGTLKVSWVAPEGRDARGGGDWISLFRVGDPDSSWGWFAHCWGASTGTFTLAAPGQAGTYEFRYMVNDYSVARTEPVVVSVSAFR